MIFWLSLDVRVAARANGGYVTISEEGAIMSLVLPTYVAGILQDMFFFVERFSVGTSILCRHFISKLSIFLLHFG